MTFLSERTQKLRTYSNVALVFLYTYDGDAMAPFFLLSRTYTRLPFSVQHVLWWC